MITLEMAIGFARKVIADHPDNINPTDGTAKLWTSNCMYVGHDGSSCIAGTIFREHLHIRSDVLSEHENNNANNVVHNLGFDVDIEASLLFQALQVAADKGPRRWGDIHVSDDGGVWVRPS